MTRRRLTLALVLSGGLALGLLAAPPRAAHAQEAPTVDDVPALMEKLQSEVHKDRLDAVKALGDLGPEAAPAVPALIEAVQGEGYLLRQLAIKSLGEIGEPAAPAVPVLVEALQDSDSDEFVRMRAAHALGQIGPAAKEAGPALAEALRSDPDEDVREAASEALQQMGAASEATLPVLVETIQSTAELELFRVQAAETLIAMDREALPALDALLTVLEEEKDSVALRRLVALAVQGLAREDARKVIPAVTKSLADGDTIVRQRAAETLALIGPEARSSVPKILPLLTDRKREVRLAAVQALRRVEARGSKEVIDALLEAAKDRDEFVRMEAGEVLGRLRAAAKVDTVADLKDQVDREAIMDRLARTGLRILLFLLGAIVINGIAKQLIVRAFRAVAERSKTQWDDYLVEHEVLYKLSHLAPAVFIHFSAPTIFPAYPSAQNIVERFALCYMVLAGTLVMNAFLNALMDILQHFDTTRDKPIKSYVQVIKILVWLCALIIFTSIVLEKSPWALLSGLGALTAVLMLIFRDSLMGLVASVQISALDLVRRGDWVEMPKYGADGDVIDMSLTTIKVRNWDKTITAIPTYAVISDSFKNWRGMTESGGRRIKRTIQLDMTSVKFVDEKLLARLSEIDIIKDYIADKSSTCRAFNEASQANHDKSLVNGRHLTNIGTFRAYVTTFLRRHPQIHQEGMTFLVRQLEPGPHGVGIQIYVFSKEQRWVHYEAIIGDIFDHLMAALPEFELRPFQLPIGSDLRSVMRAAGSAELVGAGESASPEADAGAGPR